MFVSLSCLVTVHLRPCLVRVGFLELQAADPARCVLSIGALLKVEADALEEGSYSSAFGRTGGLVQANCV